MNNKMTIRIGLVLAFLLTSAAVGFAGPPAWCANPKLMETRFFDDGGQARDWANAQSASASINGVKHTVIGTVDVVMSNMGKRVYVVHVWDCSEGGGPKPGGGPTAGGGPAPKDDKPKVTYTLDPHPELDRNGKPRNPKK